MAELFTTDLFDSANLIAYYRFNSGALTTDSKGSYTLTNNNTVGETASGKYGYGADFGSTNTNKSLTADSDLGIVGGAISMNIWVKMQTEIGSSSQFFVGQQDGGNKVGNTIFYDYNGGTRRLVFRRSKNYVANDDLNYTITLGTTNWYMLTYVYDGSEVSAYVNGVEVGTPVASTGNGTTNGTDKFGIGAGVTADTGIPAVFASAFIDDVSVFNRALTAGEVLTLFRDGAGSFLMFF